MTEMLTLTWTWEQGGKKLEDCVQRWFPVGRGRFQCGFCGESMTGKALREHFWTCAVEFGELP